MSKAPIKAAVEEPKSYVVGKAFNSVNRRFRVTDPVTPEDVVPLDFASLRSRRFIVADKG